MGNFKIDADNLTWIGGRVNDAEDLCLHGHAVATIGGKILEYDATVSATALYLLKSLTEDHIIYKGNQMLPCCGFSMYAKNDLTEVDIMGCPNGIDWTVLHEGDKVRLITEEGEETVVDLEDYRHEVFRFADKIEAFYESATPKIMPKDRIDREGYDAFWNEWRRRRGLDL